MSIDGNFTIFVNFKRWELGSCDPSWTLSYFLREIVKSKGTKIGCGEGGCGSCTVLLSEPRKIEITHRAVNSCITPLFNLNGSHVLTVEGLADDNKSCHVIQGSIAGNHGTQCGFCTPGMVMSMYGQVVKAEGKEVNLDAIHAALQGNLCRCTGYRPILEAFVKCGRVCSSSCNADIEDACGNRADVRLESFREIKNDHTERIEHIEKILREFQSSGEQIAKQSKSENFVFIRPTSFDEAIQFLQANPSAAIAGGMTELWRFVTQGNVQPITVVNLDSIPEMKDTERCLNTENGEDYLKLGASLTISEMVTAMQQDILELDGWKTRGLRAIVKHMSRYGSEQIRNTAQIGGSIMASNEASDLKLFYEVLSCWAYRYEIATNAIMSKRTPIPGRQRCLVTHLEIPYTKQNEYVWMGKVSKRKSADFATMSIAGKVSFSSKDFVHVLVLGFGGLAVERFQVDFHMEPNSTRFSDETYFKGVVQAAVDEMERNIRKENHTPLFSEEYLRITIKSLIRKFFDAVKLEMANSPASAQSSSAFQKGSVFKSSQLYATTGNSDNLKDLIGAPIVHASAYKHASGEARYCDDTPKIDEELFLALVLSDKAHAKILNIDPSEALALDGVVGFVSHEDALKNSFSIVIEDEEIFASSKVTSYGQVIGGTVATNRIVASKAAKMVRVKYEDLKPLVLNIEDAIEHSSFYDDYGMVLKRLTPEVTEDPADRTLEGEMRVGTQAHFYLEPQGCIVIPKGEDEEMEIISATQNPNDVQRKCAEALGIPSNRVVVKVKRIGGGFGGKETRCLLVALPAAVAAKKFNRPVRCILDRETDMKISGKRHVFLARYKIVFAPNGRIKTLRMTVYCDGGNTLDISGGAIERGLVNMDNAYNIPNFDVEGIVCKTNLASNTAFRGTGAPQAALIIEGILDRIAASLGIDPVQVRSVNLYKENDVTPYGQTLTNCNVSRCWEECLQMSDYSNRIVQVQAFNRQNKYMKRGISINPVHFGIAYTALFLNQGAALVHIYMDGSVLVTHGGVEIGQGLHTRLIQITSRALNLDASKIRISETATDKVPNPTPTSASTSTDLIGPAIIQACTTLLQRLETHLAKAGGSWEAAVSSAYLDRTSLSATGFFKVPRIGWNEDRVGSPFNYFSTGSACTEVELDCLTGEHTIIRTDIVMDVGESLNPAIDIGQIEGAFLQGTGFYTIEEIKIDQDGKLMTVGPSTYKIPTSQSVPQEFNVAILKGSSNPLAVYSSKTVGEPPLLLATSVFYAIKDAIRSYRMANCLPLDFNLDSPATVERIVLATHC